jgi:2-C-methyl-D-erythritol 4-phosphate cytidylyltransferase
MRDRVYNRHEGDYMKHYAIILAGGTGSRSGLSYPKQFAPIGGKPLIGHTLSAFQKHVQIEAILCVCHADHTDVLRGILESCAISKAAAIIPGGATRQGSVYNALTGFPFDPDDILLIHDAARPFVSAASITGVLEAAAERGSANLCVPATDTIIETDGKGSIVRIPDRSKMMCVQTPQGFRYEILKNAHERALSRGDVSATDDIGLVLENGEHPGIVEGDHANFKVTTARDLIIADALLSRGREFL